MKNLNQEDYPLKIEKDLGMIFPTSESKAKKRYAMFICPSCLKPYKAYVNDVRTGKSSKCKSCRSIEQSTTRENLVTGTKKCGTCGEYLPLDMFYNSINSADGKGTRCKPCDSIARQKWSRDNPVQSKQSSRNRNIVFKYGITHNDYLERLKEQGGVCAICGTKDNKGKRFSIDHCHTTHKIRGLLCNQCNRGIGMLGDTAADLKRAYDYLLNQP